MEDIFNFNDYLNKKDVNGNGNPIAPKTKQKIQESSEVDSSLEEIEIEEEELEEEVTPIVEENYYTLYNDKSETFSCDIEIEGAKTSESKSRIILEGKKWNLMFEGEIRNGKVEIPIDKLNILEDGEIGSIRLEIIAEGTVFTPWEDEFKVIASKRVTVSLNEKKKVPKKKEKEKGIGVKIKF